MNKLPADNGIYYFLGNITSHILHALPLHERLGGTFVVLSEKAKRQVEQYNVPVIALDNKPYRWKRYGYKLKPIHHYLEIDGSLKNTTDFLNSSAKVVLFYELYDFAKLVRLTKPKTVFLTHGNMLKNYMAETNRLTILKQYDYMAAMGPYMKQKLLQSGVEPEKLVDLGIARTDQIVNNKGRTALAPGAAATLGIDPQKKIISYLPTFWGPSSIYDIGKEIVRNFPDDYTLLFRPHPQTPKKILKDYFAIIAKRQGIVRYVPEGKYPGFGLAELLNASSAIIGDVSSVMLEAVLTEKPLLFAYGSGENRQTEEDYGAIKEIVASAAHLTHDTVSATPQLIEESLKRTVDVGLWRKVEDQVFFHHDGTSVTSIKDFVQKIG